MPKELKMNRKISTLEEVQHQSNLLLQILLFANVYISTAWVVAYGLHILYNLSHLRDFHGFFVITAYVVTSSAEFGRLYAGYSGNLGAKAGDLSSFLIVTLLVQFPIQVFLLLSLHAQVLVISVLMAVAFLLMCLQLVVGVYAWHQLSTHQTELFKLKRESALARSNK